MTQKQIDKILKKNRELDYPLRYWIFEDFIKDNIKNADYFIAMIEHYKKENKI